ncbi:MAG: FGGY family carbohydrate kinase [Candidatus Bathyarchaeia archaeon]
MDAGIMYIKSALFDVEGNGIAIYGREVEVRYPKPGWAEQNMMELWKATAETIRSVMRKVAVSGEDIAAVCPTGQGHGSFLITRGEKPARENALIWLDTRKQDMREEWYEGWKDKGLAAEIYDGSGWRLIFSMQVLHMAWLRPIVKPNARGIFFGLGLWTRKRDLVRAIYEGVGFATKDNIRLFEEAGIKPVLIHLVGGGRGARNGAR